MAKVNLVGVQPLDFDTREGDTIKGVNLYVTYQDENVYGYKADKKFISEVSCKNLGIKVENLTPMIGQVVELETNLKGRVIGIQTA